MRRTKMVLAVAALMVSMLTAMAGPAMANDFDRCRDLNGPFVRCDGDLFQRVNDFNDGFFFDPFFFDGFDNNGISQFNEQDVQSGDATQTFNVSG